MGGDPGAEQPQTPLVGLEREVSEGVFEAVELPNQRRYDNRAFRFMTRVREGETGYEWIARWEELKDFPTGNYRFAVEGHYQGVDGREPYAMTSAVFELLPNTELLIAGDPSASEVCGTLGYPPPQQMRWLETRDDPGEVSGHFRMRHPLVGTGISDPLEVELDVTASGLSLTLRDGDTELARESDMTIAITTAPEVVAGRLDVPVTRFCAEFPEALTSGDYDITIRVVDAHANTGETNLPFTVP